MATFVIEVNKRPFHFVHVLQLDLQRLANVMCLEQTHHLRQNDVHLDEELVSEVESADRVDVRDLAVVTQCHPSQLSEEVRPCGVSRKHLYLFCNIHINAYYMRCLFRTK